MQLGGISILFQFSLQSMHKYQPVVYIVIREDCQKVTSIKDQRFRAFYFPQTSFIAVTSYQNNRVNRCFLTLFYKYYIFVKYDI